MGPASNPDTETGAGWGLEILHPDHDRDVYGTSNIRYSFPEMERFVEQGAP